jgi:hypothetical protein
MPVSPQDENLCRSVQARVSDAEESHHCDSIVSIKAAVVTITSAQLVDNDEFRRLRDSALISCGEAGAIATSTLNR